MTRCLPTAANARRLFLLALVAALHGSVALAGTGRKSVDAPSPNQIQAVRLEVHANVDHYDVLGAGCRVELAVVRRGFLGAKVQDELALSFGGDAFFLPLDRGYYDDGAYFVPVGAAQWNVYLGPRWSVFPEAGVALHLGVDPDGHGHHPRLYVQPDLGVGVRYHAAAHFGLLFRLSTPGGLQLGLTF